MKPGSRPAKPAGQAGQQQHRIKARPSPTRPRPWRAGPTTPGRRVPSPFTPFLHLFYTFFTPFFFVFYCTFTRYLHFFTLFLHLFTPFLHLFTPFLHHFTPFSLCFIVYFGFRPESRDSGRSSRGIPAESPKLGCRPGPLKKTQRKAAGPSGPAAKRHQKVPFRCLTPRWSGAERHPF